MRRTVESGGFEEFLESSRAVAEFIKERALEGWSFTVLCHLDADGLSSGAIVGKALMRLQAPFQIRVLKQLDERSLKEVYTKDRATVFVDMGSGSLNILSSLEGAENIAVLDHHQPLETHLEEFKGAHLNPHLYGLNGSTDVSGSGVAYLVAKGLDPSNVDLSPLAVVGAIGDMQNRNDEMRLRGVNEVIVREAVESGLLKVEKDLLIPGRETKPIHRALASTMTPFIPGISGEEDKALAFLSSIGIPVKDGDIWRTLADLSEDEKRRLLDNLVAYMASRGVAQAETQRLVGEVYVLTREQRFTPLRDCREYAALLNACGRLGKPGLGIAVAMGDRRRRTLEETASVLNEYRGALARLIEGVIQNPSRLIDAEEIVIVNGVGLIPENLLSTVASILSANYPKPLIAFTETEDGMVKVSARAPKRLAEAGVNMGRIMAEAAESVGGVGGGHDVAAGALIPSTGRGDFLKRVMEFIGETVARG
ncbi:MAG: archaea-specific RecJ-like exonuclease [Candidatus Bathyarchaeota archaeon B24]|nr:MAG: archaea-specific RecJ-like exonuclease [Candidatus Bathyarchaeota archaeon B24]